MKDGKRERAFLCRVVREAWEKCGGRPSVTDVKSAFDLVTDIDFAMEKFITRAIGEEFPGDAVIGEEYNPLTELPAGRCWTVDPVDGTVNAALRGAVRLLRERDPARFRDISARLRRVVFGVRGRGG